MGRRRDRLSTLSAATSPVVPAPRHSSALSHPPSRRALNRHDNRGKDAAESVPSRNRCWFAARVLVVRSVYGLTVDRREAAALESILAGCESTALEPIVCTVPSSSGAGAASAPAGGDDALALYDDNGNGRITCAEGPAWNCSGAAVAPGVPVHAGRGRGRGWRRVRVVVSDGAHAAFI